MIVPPPVRAHILHVIDRLGMGGAERMMVELTNRMATEGVQVSACMTRAAGPLADRLDPRVRTLVLGRTRRFEIRPLLRLVQWIRQTRVGLIHCHGRSSFSLVALLSLLGGIDVPIVLHDHHGIGIDRRVPRWLRVARSQLAAYAAVYEDQIAWASSAGVRRDSIFLVPNAIDLSVLGARIVERPLPAHAGPRLVAIGGVRREKGIDVLLEAVARLTGAPMLFIVGGDADPEYAQRCRERVRRRDLAHRVTFLGQREDALALAASSDLAVHASRSESGPLVLAEYAALRVPFVSTRVGGIAERLARAGVGRYVPPDDADALSTAITEMLAMPSEARADLVSSWAHITRGLFDISHRIPEWYDLYRRVLGEQRCGS